VNAPLPQEVVAEMARRDYRMHNLLWREIRRYWNQYPRDVQEKIRELGWEPPRPATDENERPILDNNSGEDFFFTNRQLIRRVNRILTQVGDPAYPQVEGWVHLPGPGDPDFPVPPPWFDPGSPAIVNRYVARIKSDVVFEKHFRTWERTFSDPTFLRAISLGRLGALVDYYLVNPFRRRWAQAPGAMRPTVGPAETATIAVEWDDPRYDFLSDYYSMQVNPIYWRFAGWVDDRLEEWKYANGVFGDNFWTGTWAGILPEAQPAPREAAASDLITMEELTRTIAGTGLSSLHDVGDIDLSGSEVPDGGEHGHSGGVPGGGGGHVHVAP
jgi:hypothetical protein